jgi:O-antigen/teichoic acid export membrane protein
MTELNLKQKTANGLFWGGISSGVQQLIGVGFGIFLARTLNPDDYGLVGMLAIFTGIASTIINGGFSAALTNKQDATHKDYNAFFWFTFFVGLFLYSILFFSAPLIAQFYGRPELTNLTRVLFISIFFSGIAATSYTIIFKRLMVKQQAMIDMFSLLIACSVGLLLALKGFAYWALAIQTAIQTVLASVLRFIVAPWKPAWSFKFSPLKPLLSFSIKLFFTNIFMQISSNIFSVVLGKFYNATQLGYYTQGQKWMGMGHLFIGGMFTSVTQPVLVQVNEEKERQVGVLRKLIRFGAFISFPLMLGLAFIGKEFILIAIGDKWLLAVPFLQLFCIWGAVGFLWNIYTNLIISHGKSNIYMYGTIAISVLQLIAVTSTYFLGLFPMVIAYILMYFMGLLIWQYHVNRLTGLRLKDVLKDIFPYLAITLICFFVVWLITKNILNLYWLIISKIVISGLLYILIMKISHSVIFKESWMFLVSYFKRKSDK